MTKKTAATKPAADPAPPVDDTPTPDEARAMFAERPDLDAVLTTEGWLKRDGTRPA